MENKDREVLREIRAVRERTDNLIENIKKTKQEENDIYEKISGYAWSLLVGFFMLFFVWVLWQFGLFGENAEYWLYGIGLMIFVYVLVAPIVGLFKLGKRRKK